MAGLILLVLAVSIFSYLFWGYSRVSRVFFFPEDRTLSISGEARNIPRQDSLEGEVTSYVREWLLGPLDLEHTLLFPQGTKLTALFLRDGELFLDFSPAILEKGSEVSYTLDEIVQTLHKGVIFNFPTIKIIHISVDGEPIPPKTEVE